MKKTNKLSIVNYKLSIVLTLALLGLSMNGAFAQATYTINQLGTLFGVSTSGSGLGPASSTLQDKINDIKTHAAGKACTIQFGDGTNTINLGGGSSTLITFDGGASGNDWGAITLTGKATSASSAAGGIIRLMNKVSIVCKAELTATANDTRLIAYDYGGATLTISNGGIVKTTGDSYEVINCNFTAGTLNISGGTVQATTGRAIWINAGTLNISSGEVKVIGTGGQALWVGGSQSINITGGTVSAANGVAIRNNFSRTVTISGGTVTSAGDAIYNGSDGTITITGGTVKNTAADGIAIRNASEGTININGGTVESKYYTVYNEGDDGLITVSNGIVKATDTYGRAIRNSGKNAKITVTGGTIECGAEGISIANASEGTNSEITVTGGTVKANASNSTAIYNSGANSSVKVSNGNVESIYRGVYNGASNSNITITGGTLKTTEDGHTVWNNSTGTVSISGGTVTATTGNAVRNSSTGTVNITGGILFAYGKVLTDVVNGSYNYNNDTSAGIIAAWDKAAGKVNYVTNTSEHIFKFPDAATAVWAKQGSDYGISVSYKTNSGFIPLEGITVGWGVGIEELRIENGKLKIYPNPTSGELRVESGELQVEYYRIFNVAGQMLIQGKISEESSIINVASLESGIYYLRAGDKTVKFVKK